MWCGISRSLRAPVGSLRDTGRQKRRGCEEPNCRACWRPELASRKITYTRSDGSPWTLSVKDVVDRAVDFEMAYNPNDCVELRWGAPENSEEASTCKRHAPQAQRAKMSDYRAWFRERHWPAHA